ncbi:MAG: hypothetical protein JST40_00135 [Armatimonadetes bacterium]|nr:hypothetical protein [Armatimonadota bacterium]
MHRSLLAGVLLLLLTGSVGAQTPSNVPKWAKWWKANLVDRIQISGYRRLGMHLQKVQGDRDAFNSLNYYGEGQKRFTDIGQINITGRKVLGVLNFQGTILDTRLNDPQGQHFSVDYDKNGFAISAGDIQGSLLNTNRFASMNKSLRGITAGYKQGRFAAKSVLSEVKGSPKTIAIQGNNSAGPYYLQTSQIIYGSESVRVDDVPMTLGTDYIINYEAGSITFLSRTVAVTSTILVSFEALGFNDSRGSVQGFGMSYDIGRVGKLGVTLMRQISRNRGGVSTRLEKFEGFGAPSTPYFLQFEPLPSADLIIRVNGVIQREGIDYYFDPDNAAVFYFTRFMQATDEIDVVYTPKPTNTVDGDREVVGLDYSLPLGKEGRAGELKLYQAAGRLMRTPTPTSGLARGASLTYKAGDYLLSANVRKVPNGYVSVETRGFNRNEVVNDQTIQYLPSDRWSAQLMRSNSSISQKSSLTSTGTMSRFTTLTGGVAYRANTNDRVELNHRRTRTITATGQTKLNTSELTLFRRDSQNLTWTLGVNQQDGAYRGSTTGVSQFNLLGSKIGAVYSLPWRPKSKDKDVQAERRTLASVSANYALQRITAEGTTGTGRDIEIGASVLPSDQLKFSTRYDVSDSGALATLNRYTGGYGLGYGGNGFSGGTGGTTIAGGTNLRLWTTSLSYLPFERLAITGTYRQQQSFGSVTSNSRTNSTGLGLTYGFDNYHQLSLQYDRSNTTYRDSPLKSGVQSVSLDFSGGRGRWSYTLGWSVFDSMGNSTFRQDSSTFVGNISYQMAPRHSLLLDYNSGRSTGYLGQENFDWGVTYQYRIWESLALNASYRHRRTSNRDPFVQSGAYRSSGLDFELAFNFFGR